MSKEMQLSRNVGCIWCEFDYLQKENKQVLVMKATYPDESNSFTGVCINCFEALGQSVGYIVGIADSGEELFHQSILFDFSEGYREGLSNGRQQRIKNLVREREEIAEKLESISDEHKRLLDSSTEMEMFLDSEASRKNGKGYIYLMLRDDGHHKIGLSGNPSRRLSQIKRDHPSAELVHTIKADDMRGGESELHKQYSEWRKDGEWFELDRSQVEDICRLVRYDDGNFLVKEAPLNKSEESF